MITTAPTTQTPLQKLQNERKQDIKELRINIILTALTSVGLITSIILSTQNAPQTLITLSYILTYIAGGITATNEALNTLFKERSLDIDLLMVLAALAAAAVGETRDGAILLFLFSLAGTLEDYAMGRTKNAVMSLMDLRPDTANVLQNDNTTTEIPVEHIKPGQIILVKAGERIPIDGTITKGTTTIDQSTITGESTPVDKTPGDDVYAATVNTYGVIQIKATKPASESTLARMIELVTEAQSQKAPSQRISDWFGQRYTILVLTGTALALIIFLLINTPLNEALYKAATLLVVASPCAVVISVPAAILSGLAAAARGGVLFKGGTALEEFAKINIIALDKTGTLTQGNPTITDITPINTTEQTLLATASALEAQSEHPIAQNIVTTTNQKNIPHPTATNVQTIPGHGVTGTINNQSAWAGNKKLAQQQNTPIPPNAQTILKQYEQQGKTTVLIGTNNTLLGIIALADTLRPNAKQALTQLQKTGITQIIMLTGDNQASATHIANQLNITPQNTHANLLPQDKLELVNKLKEQGNVAFVGDGVNDAAALAAANVGIAMGTAGSDVAIETADIALLSDDLTKLSATRTLAKRTIRILKQNLFLALTAMVVMVTITLFAHLPLSIGVLGHEGGTIVVVFNGLRLLLHNFKNP